MNHPIGQRVASILNEIRLSTVTFGRVHVLRDRDPAESQFFSRLIEDRTTSQKSYVEYLCHLHKEIQTKLYG